MKRHFSILLFLFPIVLNGQITTFKSGDNNPFLENYSTETAVCNADTANHLSIFPRLFSVGNFNENETSSSYIVGASLYANLKNKITITSTFDYLGGNHNILIKEFQDSLGVFPGFERESKRWQMNINYQINKFITIDVGKGKHFVGNGYRSLLLSDASSIYPYLKITTEFGRVKYYNLYTTFLNPNMVDYGRKKHATIHFLDFAITKNINIGVFESILWQSKSEEVDKGFEFAYMSPVIFYRPVEFSMGSNKGNALMGAHFNASYKRSVFYGQAMLDDLNISRQKDRDEDFSGGFFQNKFAFQLGVKSEYKGVKFLCEYNQVQPYTYGHRTILQNYSHNNQAVAHPLGANFKEVVAMGEYKKDMWNFRVKITAAKVGLDSLNTHYGQNIFATDFDASTGGQYSYGNKNGQGVLTSLNTMQAEVSYNFKGLDFFTSAFYKSKKSDLLDQTFLFYSIGLRTFPFRVFTDY